MNWFWINHIEMVFLQSTKFVISLLTSMIVKRPIIQKWGRYFCMQLKKAKVLFWANVKKDVLWNLKYYNWSNRFTKRVNNCIFWYGFQKDQVIANSLLWNGTAEQHRVDSRSTWTPSKKKKKKKGSQIGLWNLSVFHQYLENYLFGCASHLKSKITSDSKPDGNHCILCFRLFREWFHKQYVS